MCEEPINIILFCEFAHRNVIKSIKLSILVCGDKHEFKLTKLNGGNLIFLTKMLRNIFKVVQFISVPIIIAFTSTQVRF